MIISYLFLAFGLLLLNAFFVLAEFAAIKLRASRVEELIDRRQPLAPLLKHIHDHIDSYLSICQFGVSLASIGLGFVGEPAIAAFVRPFMERFGSGQVVLSHGVAVTVAYVLISFFHIFFGEIVPKSIAIRIPEKSAFLTAPLLRLFHVLFYLPVSAINGLARFVLRLLGLPITIMDTVHSEKEIRIILEDSQEKGMVSFRRLLFLENILDLGALRVKNIMKPKESVRALWTDLPWIENQKVIRESRYSRYPLLEKSMKKPLGVIHAKDLLFINQEGIEGERLRTLVRRYVETTENTRLEDVLAQLQVRQAHVAIVIGRGGNWTGFLTLEDVTEQIVGAVEDEFGREKPTYLSDSIVETRVSLEIEAENLEEAISKIVAELADGPWPAPSSVIRKALLERERNATTYIGHGLAIPHARLPGIQQPCIAFARSKAGISLAGSKEKIHLIFIVITPLEAPQLQLRLISRIIRLMGSEFVEGRLREADNAKAVMETIQAGETAALA